MNPAKISVNAVGIIAGAAAAVVLAACVYSEGSGSGGGYVAAGGGAGYVEVSADSDFYEPLSPYGRWEVVGDYGRCWVPSGVGSDWRPYGDGEWVSTDDGWYWESDEPWGWATYHYGRWEDDPSIGWCWIPGTQWAPAWVSWWEGDGYVGWAPLGRHDRFEGGRFEGGRPRDRDFVFIQERRFTDRIRPTTVERNNATLIGRATSVTNFRVVNNVTINAGPHRENIERASGHTVRTVPTGQVRREREAPVIQRGQQPRSSGGGNVAPARGAPPRSSAIAPAASRPVTPPPTRAPEANHRVTTPTHQPPPAVVPAPAVTPKPQGNSHVERPHPVESGQGRVAPTHPPTVQGPAATHVSQPPKPAATPKAQPAPKGGGEHTEPKGDNGDKPRQERDN